ncbi:MAG: DUF6152 family protein [Gammaproteobacteria bacterium]
MRFIVSGVRFAVALWFMTESLIAVAHHSPNVHFDRTETVEFTGELTRIAWRNPHVLMSVRTTNDAGVQVVWDLEYLAPSFLSRQGISEELFSTGDIVRVAGYPGRTSPTALFATNILAADGREVFDFQLVGSRFTDDIAGVTFAEYQEARKQALPESAEGIFRVWTTDVALIGPDRTLWKDTYPLTERAQAAHANWDRVADNPYIRCENGMPAIMDQFYPMEFVSEGEDILLRLEELDMVRTIHMSDAFRDPSPSVLGYSIGRWDGESLVVTTTHISWPWFDQTGVGQTEAIELLERFTLSEDGLRLNYSVTATDPATFTEPIELTRDWIWLPGEAIQPYDCTVNDSSY